MVLDFWKQPPLLTKEWEESQGFSSSLMLKVWVLFPTWAPELAQHPFVLSCGRKPALNLSEGSNQITTVPYRGPIFPRNPLPSAVLTRPAELR